MKTGNSQKNWHYPAYPCNANNDNRHLGLTKREYFAAMAMQAIIQNNNMVNDAADTTCSAAAESAIRFADALLIELEK